MAFTDPLTDIADKTRDSILGNLEWAQRFGNQFRENWIEEQRMPERFSLTRLNDANNRFNLAQRNQNWNTDLENARALSQYNARYNQGRLDNVGSILEAENIAREWQILQDRANIEDFDAIRKGQETQRRLDLLTNENQIKAATFDRMYEEGILTIEGYANMTPSERYDAEMSYWDSIGADDYLKAKSLAKWIETTDADAQTIRNLNIDVSNFLIESAKALTTDRSITPAQREASRKNTMDLLTKIGQTYGLLKDPKSLRIAVDLGRMTPEQYGAIQSVIGSLENQVTTYKNNQIMEFITGANRPYFDPSTGTTVSPQGQLPSAYSANEESPLGAPLVPATQPAAGQTATTSDAQGQPAAQTAAPTAPATQAPAVTQTATLPSGQLPELPPVLPNPPMLNGATLTTAPTIDATAPLMGQGIDVAPFPGFNEDQVNNIISYAAQAGVDRSLFNGLIDPNISVAGYNDAVDSLMTLSEMIQSVMPESMIRDKLSDAIENKLRALDIMLEENSGPISKIPGIDRAPVPQNRLIPSLQSPAMNSINSGMTAPQQQATYSIPNQLRSLNMNILTRTPAYRNINPQLLEMLGNEDITLETANDELLALTELQDQADKLPRGEMKTRLLELIVAKAMAISQFLEHNGL